MKKAVICQILVTVFFGIFLSSGLANASTAFFVDSSFNSSGASTVSATLILESQNGKFYVEDDYYNSLFQNEKDNFNASLKNLADEFDRRIYPIEKEFFGSEWKPGIDGDGKIIILLTKIKPEVGGYFRLEDEYLKTQFKNSNQREMLYLNVSKIGQPLMKSYLAHEFQHLITFYQKTVKYGLLEENWLDEAKSEYATTLLGYNDQWQGSYLQKRVQDFLAQPTESLTEWNGTEADFGAAFTFISYLVDRFDKDILRYISQNDRVGISSVEDAIKEFSRPETFNDIFTDWTIANYVNNAIGEYRYRFAYLNNNLFYGFLHVLPQASYNIFQGTPVEGNFIVKDWSARWIRFAPGTLSNKSVKNLKIEFIGRGKEANFIVPYIVNKFSGDSDIGYINISGNSGIASIPGFGSTVSSVVIIPSTQFKRSGFSSNEPEVSFSFTASLIGEGSDMIFSDGAILRAANDVKVYVKKGNFKRWIRSPEIFNHYGHLKWGNIVEVSFNVLAGYQESFLIKKAGDYRIYEVDSSGAKRWLNMAPSQFEASGRKWDAIYEVNDFEFEWYKTGLPIN